MKTKIIALTVFTALFLFTAGTLMAGIDPTPIWPGEKIYRKMGVDPEPFFLHVLFTAAAEPGLTSVVDMSDPTTPNLMIYGATQPYFDILFGFENVGGGYAMRDSGPPDESGHYAWEVYDTESSLTVYDVTFDLTTSSGGVPDSSTFGGISFEPAGPGTFGARFSGEFTSMSDISMDFQVTESGSSSPMSFTLVPEPVSSTLFIIGGATLGFRRFRKKFKK